MPPPAPGPGHPPGPAADALAALRARLAHALQQASPAQGLVPHPQLAGLMLFTTEQPGGLLCGIYEPSVAVIVQGRKRVMLGDETLEYDASRYLLSTMDLPATSAILEATPARPYVSLALRLDLREMAALMVEGAPVTGAPVAGREGREGRAMATGRTDAALLDAFCRLLELPQRPEAMPLLEPLVRREIHILLLTGEQGWRLRQLVHSGAQTHPVARAVQVLRERFHEPLRIDDLAREARMSVSTFHHHFKALTAMSPLQYQKQLRLTEARRLMLADKVEAATAAYRVGYESPSQFSREYSRLFGAPPMRDIAELRASA
ncbi:AraC family transcriptional regulator [Aquabacterium sp. OR-4]|uniref:AraC family transcriptional regulator n=1 Tax=Aquabacterium sp. OR-4 TaxID=2978127 RepID=UPI0021B3BC3A|nr:AraC family transcriptional regulator [Aquabacterium sp. OR-4]MDT7837499.1 AraC family transcriptional regulator [Aquabacterium sp. OR-4]